MCEECDHSPFEHDRGGACGHVYRTGEICDCPGFVSDSRPTGGALMQIVDIEWMLMAAVAEYFATEYRA